MLVTSLSYFCIDLDSSAPRLAARLPNKTTSNEPFTQELTCLTVLLKFILHSELDPII